MSDKQVFISIIGGFLFALVGAVVFSIPIGLLQHDAGDDGFPMMWIFLSLLSGIVGLVLSAKWARRHYPEESS
jgi:hypothetical protein